MYIIYEMLNMTPYLRTEIDIMTFYQKKNRIIKHKYPWQSIELIDVSIGSSFGSQCTSKTFPLSD